MSKILENSKFILDICKRNKESKDRKDHLKHRKDVNEENDIRNISEISQNSCLYCEKVFINSKYLLKHVYRRHSNEVIQLHRRCLHSDSNDMKKLISFLEEEFSELKNELSAVKRAVSHTSNKHGIPEESNKELKPAASVLAERPMNDAAPATDIDVNEVRVLKGKVSDIENQIHCLSDKLQDYDLHKQDIYKHMILKEEKILRNQQEQFAEMKQVLLKELKSMLDKKLHENNVVSKSKLNELKHDILKLDQVIAVIKKQTDSPDYLLTLEKKIEQQINNFLGDTKERAINKSNSKPKKKLSIAKNCNAFEKNKKSKTAELGYQISNKNNLVQLSRNQRANVLNTIPEEVLTMIAEKFSFFTIPTNVSKISHSEYKEKLKLITAYKNNLKKMYPNFLEIHTNIDMSVDKEVLSRFNSKQKRKIRFSEPLIIHKDVSHNPNYLNKTYPVSNDKINHINECPEDLHASVEKGMSYKEHRFALPESEKFTFSEIAESGDCSANFEELYQNHGLENEATSGREFKTSSPINKVYSVEKENSFLNCSDRMNESFLPFGHCKKPRYTSVEMKSTSQILNDYETPNTNLNSVTIMPEVSYEIPEIDDLDETNLESLSSYEDEENPFNKDELQ